MFNKLKKLAKKAKEALKHVAEKAEEYVMAKEQIELKKIELIIDTVKSVVKNTCNAIYNRPVVLIGSAVGVALGGTAVGVAIIADKKVNSKVGA